MLQNCVALHIRRRVCGGHHGLRRCVPLGLDEASRSGSNVHQAALLDSHTVQQVCVHGRRHTGEERATQQQTTHTQHTLLVQSLRSFQYILNHIFILGHSWFSTTLRLWVFCVDLRPKILSKMCKNWGWKTIRAAAFLTYHIFWADLQTFTLTISHQQDSSVTFHIPSLEKC